MFQAIDVADDSVVNNVDTGNETVIIVETENNKMKFKSKSTQ